MNRNYVHCAKLEIKDSYKSNASEYGRDVGGIVIPADFLDLLERLIPIFNLLIMHQRDPAACQHVFLLTLLVSRCVL